MNILPLLLAPVALAAGAAGQTPPLRLGIIGLDTSHTTSFAHLLNEPQNPDRVPGATIVAAWKGGSPDVADSATRVDKFTAEMTGKYGVKLYDTIEDVVRNVDAVMILSVDGRPHLDEARKVFPFHKPVFIDKPLAGSLRDAIEIFRLAAETKTPVFSASSRRFDPSVVAVQRADLGTPLGAFSYGPATLEP